MKISEQEFYLSRRTKGLLISIIIIISVGFISLQLKQYAHDASLSHWNSGFEGFVKSSRWQQSSQQPVAVLFYTDWCPNCKELREKILSQKNVDDYLTQLMPVRINPELGILEEKLSQDFGVFAYPAFFILPEDGNIQDRVQIHRTANVSPEIFIEQIKQAIGEMNTTTNTSG